MPTLHPIERRSHLTSEEFEKEYLQPLKPVILTDLTSSWSAKEKWSFDFFKTKYGDIEVPVFSSNSSKSGDNYMAPDLKIPLRQYIESIEEDKSDYRLFLFNMIKEIPELSKDYQLPEHLMSGWLREYPFMFFGSKGSKVPLHYDIDLAHIFLSQFHGQKRFVLFPNEMSKKLYRHPFTVASYVDVNNPDYDRFPALRNVWGYETYLQPGETIFMPSGYWHYIEYTETSFSMNQRANESFFRKAKGIANIARHFVVDKGMNRLFGEDWKEMKTRLAKKRAEKPGSNFKPIFGLKTKRI